MGKRKYPFGYQLEWGQIVVNQAEAEVVQYIFHRYAQGSSYTDLSMYLNQLIRYDCEKNWNKNMVARILEDRRYLGEQGYPVIIQQDLFQKAAQQRLEKQAPIQKTKAQKILRRLCGQPVTYQIEQNVLKILNSLIDEPSQIYQSFNIRNSCSDEIQQLETELETLMAKQPVNEDKAQQCIMKLAEVKYKAICSNDYETQCLQNIFEQLEPMKELDENVLKAAVSEIYVLEKGVLTIRLKNGQSIAGK